MREKKWERFFWISAFCGGLTTSVYAQSIQERDLSMGVHQHMEFPSGIQRIAIADDSVVDISVERMKGAGNPARLLLTPLKTGTTSLMVWSEKNDAPTTWMLNVKPSVQVRKSQYPSLSEMAVQEAARNVRGDAAQSPIANASGVLLKSNVVQVDVKVVEVNKNRMQQAGLNIFSTGPNSHGFSFGLLNPAFAATADVARNPFAQAFGLLMNFGKANIGVNFGVLESHGMARVLAEPTLLAISGQSANFLAGGEIPVPVSQGDGAISIEYKPYGVGLTVSPTVLDNQRIVLKVAPESSELDPANAVTLQGATVPALTTRRADTTVELGDGESFVIGGLVSQRTNSSVNRVPLLSEIPILGTMFKRQEFYRNDRELVIVVTPRLVKPIAADQSLAGYMPGNTPVPSAGFWPHYIGPMGGSDQFPGFSQ